MRVIKRSRVHGFCRAHPDAETSLKSWLRIVRHANWRNFTGVRSVYPSADAVKVQSGRTVVVFNIGGNKYRMIVAVHYNTAKVYVLRFLTDEEYDEGHWKEQL
jgi:mRNA interferase HigB